MHLSFYFKHLIEGWIQTNDAFQGCFCKSHQVTSHLLEKKFFYHLWFCFLLFYFFLRPGRQIRWDTQFKSYSSLEKPDMKPIPVCIAVMWHSASLGRVNMTLGSTQEQTGINQLLPTNSDLLSALCVSLIPSINRVTSCCFPSLTLRACELA